MTEATVTMAPLVMMVLEMTAAMAAATMMMVTSAWFLQSSAVDFQAPTGGSVSVDVSSR
jgi:ABC-type transport system involved in cytochrome bd biosynthesis fused ATPase/permease subunit